MVHHMMNHMVRQVGPRIRDDADVAAYQSQLATRPAPRGDLRSDRGFETPGYPQKMQNMFMPDELMKTVMMRREAMGMHKDWAMGVKGLMTALRVLPPDLYDLVMTSGKMLKPGEVFDRVVRGEYDRGYQQG